MDEPLNHNEAWSLAHIRRERSNMARCYIELRQAAKAVVDECSPNAGPSNGSVDRLRAITTANDQ